MTSFPVEANASCWWLTTIARWKRLHAVPLAALDPSDEDAVEELTCAPGPVLRAVCGYEGRMTMPGPFSRLGMRRCSHCCRKLGITAGKGTPANERARTGDMPVIRKPNEQQAPSRPETGCSSAPIVRKPDARPARVDNFGAGSLRLVLDLPTLGGVTVRRTTPTGSSLVGLRAPDPDLHSPLDERPVFAGHLLAARFCDEDAHVARLQMGCCEDVGGYRVQAAGHVRVSAGFHACGVDSEAAGHDAEGEQGLAELRRLAVAPLAGACPDVAVALLAGSRDAERAVTADGAAGFPVGAVLLGVAKFQGDVLGAAQVEAATAGHAGKSLLAGSVTAGSSSMLSTLLVGSEAGPAFVLADGVGFAAYLAGSVLAGLAGSAPALRWPSCLRGRYSCRARQLTHVRRREGREFRDRRRWHTIAEGVKYGGYRFIACTPAGVVNLDVTTCGRLERGHVLGFVHAANTIATNLRLSSVRISMGDMRKAMTQASTRNIKVG